MVGSDHINAFSRLTQVSRETILSLAKYEEILKIYNKNLNLVGKSTLNNIWNRHFLDSFKLLILLIKIVKLQ